MTNLPQPSDQSIGVDQSNQPPLTPEEALAERDISLALTPWQGLIGVVAVFLLIKVIRSLRR